MGNKITVGITQGDTNGIGYEIIIKALMDSRIFDLCTPVIYGSSKFFGFYKRMVRDAENLTMNVVKSAKEAHNRRINIINIVPEEFDVEVGMATDAGAKAALLSLTAAVEDLKSGAVDVMVTAPFNKSSVSKEGFAFPGHTEYLSEKFGVSMEDSLMFMVSERFKLGLVTCHAPLSKVTEMITTETLYRKLKQMIGSIKVDFAVERPKIAVLALNPHAGDEGLMGGEETDVIRPVIESFVKEGELIFGPFASDGFFASELMYKYDAVLAMYHDQGLIPFKSIAFDSGVNYTAGLPVVRCSPAHGPAYDIAGKDKANHLPMLSAIYTACGIAKSRVRYEELRKNRLNVELPSFTKEIDD